MDVADQVVQIEAFGLQICRPFGQFTGVWYATAIVSLQALTGPPIQSLRTAYISRT